MLGEETITLIKLGATVSGATATVIGIISKPLWSKLNKLNTGIEERLTNLDDKFEKKLDRMECGIDVKREEMEARIDAKLDGIGTTVDGIKARVGEQNGRVGKLETWCKMHEDHDDERHQESIDSRKEVVKAINGLRDKLNQ